MRKRFPESFNFFPPTWLLPVEWSDFKAQFNFKKAKTFIIKPEAQSQGKGIFLTRRVEDLDPNEHYVAQRYIHRPLLIDGLKFDLRVYALVNGVNPLRVYVYKEGLARFATEEYTPPVGNNLENMYMHLTNYAINKNSYKFQQNSKETEGEAGHKRSL